MKAANMYHQMLKMKKAMLMMMMKLRPNQSLNLRSDLRVNMRVHLMENILSSVSYIFIYGCNSTCQ